MPRFRRHFFLPLLAALGCLPRPASAALIPRYDLESLCCLSTDAVEATLVRHHVAGQEEWKDTFTAVVINSVAGQYKPGDKIASLDLELYAPSVSSQHCILFITHKEFQFDAPSSKTIAPKAVDMLLVDSHNQVQRYYQLENPGGLTAEASQKSPTLAAERIAITLKWVDIDHLRLLLSRPPRPEDVSALQALVRERRQPSGPMLWNIISSIAQERLALLHVKAN